MWRSPLAHTSKGSDCSETGLFTEPNQRRRTAPALLLAGRLLTPRSSPRVEPRKDPGTSLNCPPRLGLDQPGCRRPPADKAENAEEAAEYHAYIESHFSTINADTPEADRMALINEAVRYFKERWPDGPPT